MPLVLERHHCENDRDLDFADYRHQLWNETWDSSALRKIQLETLILAAFVRENLGVSEGLLSYDSQRLLARYDLVGSEWCDATTVRWSSRRNTSSTP